MPITLTPQQIANRAARRAAKAKAKAKPQKTQEQLAEELLAGLRTVRTLPGGGFTGAQEAWLGEQGFTWRDDTPDEAGGGYWENAATPGWGPDSSGGDTDRGAYDWSGDMAGLISQMPVEFLDQYYGNLVPGGRMTYQPGGATQLVGRGVPPELIAQTIRNQILIDAYRDPAALADQQRLQEQILLILDPNRGYDSGGFGGFLKEIPGAAGHAVQGLAANPAVMAALTGYLATPVSAGGAGFSPIAAGATAGGLAGTNAENPIEGMLMGGILGGGATYLGGQAGGMFDDPIVSGIAKGATIGGMGALVQGGDPLKAAVEGGVFGGLSGVNKPGTPSISDQDFAEIANELDLTPVIEQTPGMLPAPTGSYFQPTSTTGENILFGTPETPAQFTPIPDAGGVTYTPADPTVRSTYEAAGLIPQTGMLSPTQEISDADFADAATEEYLTGAAPATTSPTTDYGKLAKQLYGIYQNLHPDGAPIPEYTPPVRKEGQTDEEYATEVAETATDYITQGMTDEEIAQYGLDAESIADAGLTPGTPEYLDYIISRADQIIADIIGKDPSALMEGESVESLQAAFEALTAEEMADLTRALYVRGALGSLTFGGSAQDPFTGITEELGPGDVPVQGATAAAHRGYARSLERMAQLPTGEAMEELRRLLGRKPDLFGLQTAYDKRAAMDRLMARDEEEDPKRKRKSSDVSYWQNILAGMNPDELEQLLASLGA